MARIPSVSCYQRKRTGYVNSRPMRMSKSLPKIIQPREAADPRLYELQRMRSIATLLLGLMTVLFLATSLFKNQWSGLAYVQAFAEAGMVGACADWFAVVALFRKPLGLPIPHTGIIPQNKKRIGLALGRFVANNFLSPKLLAAKLASIDVAGWLGNWLAVPANCAKIARQAADVLPQILGALPQDQLRELLAIGTRRGLEQLPAAPFASQILSLLWAEGAAQTVLDGGIELAEASILQYKDFITAKVAQKTYSFVPKWVDALLAEKVMSGLKATLGEMRQKDHPWRNELRKKIEKLILDLANDPQMQLRAEAMKRELMESALFAEQLKTLSGKVAIYLVEDVAAKTETIARAFEHTLIAMGEGLNRNAPIKHSLNRWSRRAVLQIISPRREDIGNYIAHVVGNWDSTTLVNKLELQVGRDLQYVRINGTLVGGLVGLIIFTLSQWLLPL
jgi:uncharacterized membrane-anchored protein YjiN (DUF445 family)